jgi:hypothetical protein
MMTLYLQATVSFPIKFENPKRTLAKQEEEKKTDFRSKIFFQSQQRKLSELCPSGFNFINVLCAAFAPAVLRQ